jgi:hypothetical protein
MRKTKRPNTSAQRGAKQVQSSSRSSEKDRSMIECSTLPETVSEEVIPRSEYLEARKDYVEGEQQAYRSFDNAIMTLSSAILGLSITFTQAFTTNPQYKEVLFISWCSLIIALISTVSSIWLSQISFRAQRAILDRLYEKSKTRVNYWDKIVGFLNWLSLVAFTVGICALAFFGYLNVR